MGQSASPGQSAPPPSKYELCEWVHLMSNDAPCWKSVYEPNKLELHNQGITFEKARRATNRSLKMTIWSLGSDLCYGKKNIRQGAPL